MYKRLILAAVAASALSSAGQTQTEAGPPPPPADARGVAIPTDQPIGTNPAIEYLRERHGVSKEEATRRLEIQDLVTRQLGPNSPNKLFDDVYIEHEPEFRVVVTFAQSPAVTATSISQFVASLDPRLRQYIKEQIVSRTRAQNLQTLETVARALNLGQVKFDAGYFAREQKVVVTVPSAGIVARVNSLVPADLRQFVEVRVSPLVGTQQATAPVGAQPGDYAQGGMTIHHSSTHREEGQPWCTAGYAVTYKVGTTTKQGIVTAGHCAGDVYLYINDHYIRLGQPLSPLSQTDSGIYDYAVYDIGSAVGRNIVEYKNYNAVPNFPDRGTFRVTDWITSGSAREGYTVCKSGFTTGITCGKILSTFVGSGIHYGYVEVGDSVQERLSKPGDSGGPWFYYMSNSTNVYAMGIHSRGIGAEQTCSKQTCRAYYMPIDRTWVHNSTVRPRTN